MNTTSRRVVIIDHSNASMHYHRMALTDLGFEVIQLLTIDKFLKFLESDARDTDFFIAEMEMPCHPFSEKETANSTTTGLLIIKKIRQKFRKARVSIITLHSSVRRRGIPVFLKYDAPIGVFAPSVQVLSSL